jgi:NAD(P)-dependent dehydrogenase (short-subunit alcohol dehydrogenase family)
VAGANRAVVITGASTGIGRACALRLDGLGWDVFAGVRRDADGERLREAASERLVPVTLDVTDHAAIAAAAERVEKATGERGLAGLVNNAGVAVTAPLEFLPLDDLRQQLEVNLVGQIAVTQAFLPLLRRARGRVVNIGSVGGRVALPFMGPYHASKFGMEGLTDSLRQELRPFGIEVSIVEPGTIATDIWEKGAAAADDVIERMPERARELYGERMEAMRAAALEAGPNGIAPDAVARVVEHALTARRPRTRYLVGRDAKTNARVSRVVPDRIFDRLVARQLGG